MTNLTSIAGGAIWIAVASLLMLATLEPVSLQNAPVSTFTLAHAHASADRAAA